MKYYNYLKEDIFEERKEIIKKMLQKDNIFDELKNSDFVKMYIQSPNYILYRGTKKSINIYKIFSPKSNRQPNDMPIHLHKEFDYEFNKKFGWKARSEGVFATRLFSMAGGYGKPYVFIPLGKYKFIYSNKISDLYAEIFERDLNCITDLEASILEQNDYMIDMLAKEYNIQHIPSYEDVIQKIIDSYTDKNIVKAILSKKEIMFKCDRYVMFDENTFKDIYHIFK